MTTPTAAVYRRPVTFGNPALGTYGGCVYTLENSNSQQQETTPYSATSFLFSSAAETPTRVSQCVALVNVPPEQCPEGILTFARSHRQFVEHVRILIASAPSEQVVQQEQNYSESSTPGDTGVSNSVETSVSPLDQSAVAETHDRTYIILFQLSTEKAATVFVKDLHGKPYTSLDETQVASVFPVVAVHGDDGVDLIHPFFAARIARRPALSMDSTTAGGGRDSSSSSSSSPLHEGIHPNELRSAPSTTTAITSSSEHENNTSIRAASPQHNIVSSTTEGHNCAVCLEDMNVGTTSLLTTVCNHSFHLDCLLQWQDSPCPVCRYDHSGLNEALSQCHVCGTTEDNYVCLICGVVSCGGARRATRRASTTTSETFSGEDNTTSSLADNTMPPSQTATATTTTNTDDSIMTRTAIETSDQSSSSSSSPSQPPSRQPMSHARQHYDETLHAYALDTETQHVWDFCGQGYVHRLLQNAKDGKLVEVNDPNSTSQERTLSPGLSDAQEEEVVHRKLEGFASQYYTLLKSQLEQQRIFYEGRLEEVRREYGPSPSRKKSVSAGAELISALKQERNQLAQRCMSLRQRYEKVSEDVAFLKNMNESLTANKGPMKREIMDAQQSRAATREMIQQCLPPLEEKVQQLMLQLEDSIDDGGVAQGKFDQKPAAK
jgi:hypothetical protein